MSKTAISPIVLGLKDSAYDLVRIKCRSEITHALGDGDGHELGELNKTLNDRIDRLFPYNIGITMCTFDDVNGRYWALIFVPDKGPRYDEMVKLMYEFWEMKYKPSELHAMLDADFKTKERWFINHHYTVPLEHLQHLGPCKIKIEAVAKHKKSRVMIRDISSIDMVNEDKEKYIKFDFSKHAANVNFSPDESECGSVVGYDVKSRFPVIVKFHGMETTERFEWGDLTLFGDPNLAND